MSARKAYWLGVAAFVLFMGAIMGVLFALATALHWVHQHWLGAPDAETVFTGVLVGMIGVGLVAVTIASAHESGKRAAARVKERDRDA